MPDDDDGWGGTADLGWTRPGPTPAPAPFAGGGPSGPAPVPPGGPGHAPLGRPGAGRNRLIAAAVAVVVVVVVLVVVLHSNSGPGHHTAISSPPASPRSSSSVPPSSSPSVSTPAGGGSLLQAAPFGPDCVEAPKTSYDTPAVAEQVVCTGSQVTSSVSAAGVAYAKFSSADGLNAWYTTTILKANGIVADAGNCQTGTTVATTGGAEYCEGAFTDDTGATTARQLVVRAPATIMLTNGPNSSAADCPNSAYTLLVFTAPSRLVGAVVLTCSSAATVADAFESALTSGAFDLTDQ